MQKKRLFNNRPLCFFAAFLTLGILVVETIYTHDNLFRLIPLLIAVVVAAGLLIFKITRKFTYLAVAFIIGVLAMSGASDLYSSRAVAPQQNVTVQAVVKNEVIVKDGKTSFYVTDVTIDGKKLDGNTYVGMDFELSPNFGAGDTIELTGSISNFEHNRFDTYYAWSSSGKTYYYFNAKYASKLSDGELRFPQNFQLIIKQLFYENTDEDTAVICQALILGDKRGMDDTLYDSIKNSGMAHVLAVSGLHITALASALYWLLKKLKVNSKASFIVVMALTFVYSMLCSFTPSVLRAFIMTGVLNFAGAFGLKKDNLSSLAFAACVLLLINPITLFDVGFLLSVFAMLGMFLFYKPMNALGMKIVDKISPKKQIGKKLSESVAISISANTVSFPLIGLLFETVPMLFVLSSVIILPYTMFIWLILLINTAFALITTLWGSVAIMDYLMLPFTAGVKIIGGLPLAVLDVGLSGALGAVAVIYCFVFCLIISRFVFLSKRVKAVVLTLWTIVCALACLCVSAVLGAL